jgi:hypothetical protein
MIDKITHGNLAEVYGLGADVKVVNEKSVPTKTEAAEHKGSVGMLASGPRHYQLEGPKSTSTVNQASTVVKLMDTLAPTHKLLMENMNKAVSGKTDAKSESVSQALTLLTLLFQVSKLSRNQQLLQREIAVEANVASLKGQADELDNAAKAMFAMAIVSGVMAGLTAVLGTVGHVKATKRIKNEFSGNKALKIQPADVQLKADTMKQGRMFEKQMSKNNGYNGLLQSLGQVASNVGNGYQTEAQAAGKEQEIHAARAQNDKQKADEYLSNEESFMKHMIDMFTKLSESQNRAYNYL